MATKIGVVYGIHVGDMRIRYVGITTRTAEERLKQHLDCALKRRINLPLMRWLRKHTDVQVTVLEKHNTVEALKAAEIRLIIELRTRTEFGGLNCTDGGDGLINPSADIRAKISASITEVMKDPTRRELQRRAATGRSPSNKGTKGLVKMSDETRRKMSQAAVGRKKSDETRRKMSQAQKTRYRTSPRPSLTPEHVEKAKRGPHNRWHVARGLTSPTCKFCVEVN